MSPFFIQVIEKGLWGGTPHFYRDIVRDQVSDRLVKVRSLLGSKAQ